MPPPKLGSPRGCLSQPRACVPSVQLAQRTSSQSHTPSQSHTLQQLLQRSTLRDGRVGVGALGKTCAAAGRRGGQAGGLAERGVRRGVLCLLVLRAASTRMVPPTRARRTCAHVGLSCVVSGGVTCDGEAVALFWDQDISGMRVARPGRHNNCALLTMHKSFHPTQDAHGTHTAKPHTRFAGSVRAI